jgi:hypothetical protein
VIGKNHSFFEQYSHDFINHSINFQQSDIIERNSSKFVIPLKIDLLSFYLNFIHKKNNNTKNKSLKYKSKRILIKKIKIIIL